MNDPWYVQVVGPSGYVTYLTSEWKEVEGKEQGAPFDSVEAAGNAADVYRDMCKGQIVIIHVVPLDEGDE